MSEQLISTPGEFGENGNFLLERELGAGGMGGVYMGRDKMLDRPVAVKVMLKEYGADPEFVEKFKKEAQAAAKLIHPNIAQIYSYGISKGMPYIAMELVAGGSLYSLMKANPGKTDIQRVIKICQQTAMALQCATDQGFVHGDVKPENILLDANGNAKLVDFGLAAMQKDTSEIWGTPYYISPEKVKKEVVDFRADMYSLGGTLYHALTGVPPFDGDDSVAVVKKRFMEAPKLPSEIRPEITPEVDELVMTMLALNKEDRYPSFESLLLAFQDVLTIGLATQRVPPIGSVADGGKRQTSRTRRVSTTGRIIRGRAVVEEEEEEEAGSGIGLKVTLFVLGGLLVIGAVVGGLFWFKEASERARQEEAARTINANCEKARQAIRKIRENTVAFEAECRKHAENAIAECEVVRDGLKQLLPNYESFFKFEMSDEIKNAIALVMNPPAAATSETNAPSANTSAQSAPAKPAADAKGGKKEKKASEVAKPANNLPKDGPAATAIAEIKELWDRAYNHQLTYITVSEFAKKLIADCDAAFAQREATEANMKALGDLSIKLKDKFDEMKALPNVDKLRNGAALIKEKGKKIISAAEKSLRAIGNAAETERRIKEREKEEKKKKEELERKRKALVEAETSGIAKKFDEIVEQGCIRQLDWKTAKRLLESASESYKTAEGQLAAELQIDKVKRMQKMHDIFIKNLEGYAFRGKLKGSKVVKVDDKDIHLQKSDRKSQRISWQSFYKDYPGNLNELINHFIVSGKKTIHLNQKDFTEAMSGAALTMRLVCPEVNGAAEKAEELAKTAAKEGDFYAKKMKDLFPDMDFSSLSDE
ncbi:MAG: serine/threonine protein kinase [Kiritimatiellae bacterium]|nr:serine/threonine protein kinase [Kiritimatiellia bacterium]